MKFKIGDIIKDNFIKDKRLYILDIIDNEYRLFDIQYYLYLKENELNLVELDKEEYIEYCSFELRCDLIDKQYSKDIIFERKIKLNQIDGLGK